MPVANRWQHRKINNNLSKAFMDENQFINEDSSWADDEQAFSAVSAQDNVEEYLGVLNEQQREAVEHSGSPLLILAGAGSGKTRVITTKIAYLIARCQIRASSILAVTFTKKAAAEMQERAIALDERAKDAQIRTFHSFGAWFLRLYAEEAGIDSNFTVYDDDDMVTLLKAAVPTLAKKDAPQIAHSISLAKDYCITSDDEDSLFAISDFPDFPKYYKAYEARKMQTGNVDFGDLIMLPTLILQKNEALRNHIRRRFRVVMVDEYQDSNVAQFQLLKQLSGDGVYTCVVGDDDQSIYRFRGAEVQNILTFSETFPNTKIIRLEKNYRSTAPILAAADSVVKNNGSRLGKTLRAERGNGKKPTLVFLDNRTNFDMESQFCAELIENARKKGGSYSDWAILYRTNAQSLSFETEFLHRQIPYRVVGSLKFYEREEVKDSLALLSLCANARDEVSFRRIVNKPARSLGEVTQKKIIDFAHENALNLLECESAPLSKKALEGYVEFTRAIKDSARLLGDEGAQLSDFVREIIEKSGIAAYHKGVDEISGTQKTFNLQELVNSAASYTCTTQGLLSFLDAISLDRTLAEQDEGNSEDFVTLITIHNTKGLEFKKVIMTGMESGLFPREDKTGSDLEEERRLCYVGITRARDELYFTCCAARRFYGRIAHFAPSIFLSELDKDNLRVLGNPPYSFGKEKKEQSLEDFEGWNIGAVVRHNEYGYGTIESAKITPSGEFVVNVKFKSGETKKFLPAYQKNSLKLADSFPDDDYDDIPF